MSEKEKSRDCCEGVTATLRCEGDTLVIRLEGKEGQRLADCCRDAKGERCC